MDRLTATPPAEASKFESIETREKKGRLGAALGRLTSRVAARFESDTAQDEVWGDIVDIANDSRDRGEPGLPIDEGPDVRHITYGHDFDKIAK